MEILKLIIFVALFFGMIYVAFLSLLNKSHKRYNIFIHKNEHKVKIALPITGQQKTKNINEEKEKSPFSGNCVINIHGFPHSGTGLFEITVKDALNPLASVMEHTETPQNEGQWLQSVYPNIFERIRHTEKYCAYNATEKYRAIFICPKLQDKALPRDATLNLWKSWSRWWDLSKPFLIQKTPAFDMTLLKRIITNSKQMIVIRHPMFWSGGFGECRTESKLESKHGEAGKFKDLPGCIRIWAKVWQEIFRNRRQNKEEDIIVHYEDMVLNSTDVKHRIRETVGYLCPKFPLSLPGNNTRHLRVRSHGDVDLEYLWPRYHMRKWENCLTTPSCIDELRKLEPFTRLLGYSILHTTQNEILILPFPDLSWSSLTIEKIIKFNIE